MYCTRKRGFDFVKMLYRTVVSALLLLGFAAAAQTASDNYWTGYWGGPFSFVTPCGFTNAGTITLNLSVSGGSVTGTGIQDTAICYDGQCNIFGYGTFSGK